jgi:hypothetical protein
MIPRRTVGRYSILGELGSGGMAEVLLAQVRGPGGFAAPLALKRILPHLARDPRFVQMFLDEARLLARARHPNVVRVTELGQENDELFLAMEYLEGESFASLGRRLVAAGRSLSFPLAAYLVAEAAAGLHATHEIADDDGTTLGVVHRDVSPQNLFVTYDGHVKVLDFGVAKAADRLTVTQAGELKGKLEYMSPEQARGQPLDRRSDVFALGIVLYEISLQRRLFKRPSQLRTLQAITEEPIVPPSRLDPGYPSALERIVKKALAARVVDRYPSAAALRRDLLAFVRRTSATDAAANDGDDAEASGPAAPEEALALLMREIFADRILQKGEMLRRARDGESLGTVPAAETDVHVELPETMAEPARNRRPLAASVAAVGIVALSSLAAYRVLRTPPAAVAVAPPEPVAVAPPEPVAVQPDPVVAPSPAALASTSVAVADEAGAVPIASAAHPPAASPPRVSPRPHPKPGSPAPRASAAPASGFARF